MKLVIFIMLIYNAENAFGQKATQQDYINSYHKLAQKEQLRTGVPAAITLAQGILESENGESTLATKSNNHFGIKCKNNWTGEKVYHNDDLRGECFRKYETVEQSFADHSDFLKNSDRYANLFELNINDYVGWSRGLKAAGYATNPVYAEKLIQLIEKLELHKFNDLGYSINTNNTANLTFHAEDKNLEDAPTEATDKSATSVKVVNVEQPIAVLNKETTNNRTKAIYLPKGSSLLAVAIHYDIPLNKLLEFNDLPKNTNDILPIESIIYLQRKRKESDKPTYAVQEATTMHQIAQKIGVRLDSLQKMNQGMQPNNIKAGTIIITQSKIKK
jgi:LysM repeat protein